MGGGSRILSLASFERHSGHVGNILNNTVSSNSDCLRLFDSGGKDEEDIKRSEES